MRTVRLGDDIREVIGREFVRADSMIECVSDCEQCSAYFYAFAEISDYVFKKVVMDCDRATLIIPNEVRSYAEEMGLLSP